MAVEDKLHFKATMFQCMVKLRANLEEIPFDLRRMYGSASMEVSVLEMKAKAPGSLGQEMCMSDACWKVGSLAMRVQLAELVVSVFVFESGKIKISGGSAAYHARTSEDRLGDDTYNAWLETRVIHPVVELLLRMANKKNADSTQPPCNNVVERKGDYYTWELCLLNGSTTLNDRLVNASNYRKVCDQVMDAIMRAKHPFFVSATMPVCYDVDGGHKRGRVCSTALRFCTAGGGGGTKTKNASLRFDHGGRVQFFAVRSFDDLYTASVQLNRLLAEK